jgi:hypothetical protein
MAKETLGIPELPVTDIIPAIDDSAGVNLEGFSYYKDGRPIITRDKMLLKLRDENAAKDAAKYALGLFEAASDNPEKLRKISEEFMFEGFGYNVQSGEHDSPLFVRNGVMRINDVGLESEELSVVELSPKTCDQFLGVFLGEINTFPPFHEELNDLSDLAIRSYSEGAFAMALYDHLLVSRWLSGATNNRDYLRYTRAAKSLMKHIIGDDEFTPPDMETVRYRLAGGIAFRRMMERMKENYYFEDGPYEDRIDTFRGKLALRAIRSTHDDFFIGVASPLGEEEQEAYITTAALMSSPRVRH